MKANIKKTVLICLSLSLIACKTVGPDYKRIPANLPATYSEPDASASSANKTQKQWWLQYQDPKLNALIELSLKNNTNIALAVARIEEADASMREVGASLQPQVDLNAGATRSKVTELGAFPTFGGAVRNHFNFGLSTSYEIDFWGKIKRNKESATANALASRAGKDTVELSLIGLVASNYLQLRGLDAQIAVTKDNQVSRKEALSLNQRRLAGGVASALEVSQAEVTVSNLDAQLIELTRLRALTLHQLTVLTGQLDLTLAEGDLRSSVSFGTQGGDHCARGQSFGGFNSVGNTIEWRLKDGKPIATILRWSVSYDPEDSVKQKEWLVVTKLEADNSCHLGYVEGAYPNANAVAQKLADGFAESFSCKTARPIFIARVGTVTDGIAANSGCAP